MPHLTEIPAPQTTYRPRLLLTWDGELDWLTAVEFGRVSDGQPDEAWVPAEGFEDHVRYLRDPADHRVFGFAACDVSQIDLDAPGAAVLWDGPRFDVPQLGLVDVPAAGVIAAARAEFGHRDSFNRMLFVQAMDADGVKALRRWSALLESGDAIAHYGLGYTLHDLGFHRDAYRHLRHYSEIAPHGAWVWCWYGKAAEAIGELAEARAAYERAIALEAEDEETDAAELLEALAGGGNPRS